MKHLITTLLSIALCTSVFAQSPEVFSYQAVARDASGSVIGNQAVAFRISLISGSITGTTEYSETHAVTTNDFGLVNLSVGNGTVVLGDFSTIDWSAGPYFLAVELDADAGTPDFVLMGSTQLLSVPYALYAKNSGSTTNPPSSIYHQSGGLNNGNTNATTTYQPVGPVLNITKTHADSKIEATCVTRAFSGTFSGAYGVKFEIRVDGVTADYDYEANIKNTNTEESINLFAVFENLAVGSHDVQIYVKTNIGTSAGVYLDSGGWGARIVTKETF